MQYTTEATAPLFQHILKNELTNSSLVLKIASTFQLCFARNRVTKRILMSNVILRATCYLCLRVEWVWLREGRVLCSCLCKYLVGQSRFCHAPPCNMLAVHPYPYSPRTFLNFLLLLLLLLLLPQSPSLLPPPPSIFIFIMLLPR